MKTKNFYDIHQAYAYIADTVIRFKGQPVYVHEIGFYDGPRGPYELIFRYIGEHPANFGKALTNDPQIDMRSEEHTSELQSLMRISYAVFCLKKKKINKHTNDGMIN